jgi:hypothetical protein
MKLMHLFESSHDTPDQLYHVSRSSNRESIIAQGLKPQNVEFIHIDRDPAVYGFETLNQAQDWAFFFAMDIGESVDIWKMNVRGMHVELDPSDEMQEAYDSWIVKSPIPPQQIKFVKSMPAHTSTRHAPPLSVKVRPRIREDRKPSPTNPGLWREAIAQAKRKFAVWPSAYASGWAAAYYKRKGGKWRMED